MNVVNIYILEEIDLTYMVFTFKDNTYYYLPIFGIPRYRFSGCEFYRIEAKKRREHCPPSVIILNCTA